MPINDDMYWRYQNAMPRNKYSGPVDSFTNQFYRGQQNNRANNLNALATEENKRRQVESEDKRKTEYQAMLSSIAQKVTNAPPGQQEALYNAFNEKLGVTQTASPWNQGGRERMAQFAQLGATPEQQAFQNVSRNIQQSPYMVEYI